MAMMVAVAIMAAGCSKSEGRKNIEKFCEQLNSDEFKSNARATKIFSDASAEMQDTALVLTFEAVEGLSFSRTTNEMIEMQRLGMIRDFRGSSAKDATMRAAFEGMKQEGMVFTVVFRDVKGGEAIAVIRPQEILE